MAFLVLILVIAYIPSSSGILTQAYTSGSVAKKSEDLVGCGTCHPSQHTDWNMSVHSQAFSNPVFQDQWNSEGRPDICLECHASGEIDLNVSERSTGVSCEMCHGPGSIMSVDISAENCGRCHSYSHYPTYVEWLESQHSHHGVGCLECHEMHSLELKTEEPIALCAGCHPEITSAWEGGTHGVSEEGCTDCHMIKLTVEEDGEESMVTGHTFFPGVPDPDCEKCHEAVIEGHMAWEVGAQGCLTCHDSIYMTRLHLGNHTSIEIHDSSVLCGQCHQETYYEWTLQMHGSSHEKKFCVDCHTPWEPEICFNTTLPGIPINVPSTADQVLQYSVTKPSLPFIALIGILGTLLGSIFISRRWLNG